jgi:predicted ATPase
LLEDRPAWGGGKLNSASILLDELSQLEREILIENAGGDELPAETAARIAGVAEGNPLFLEQMVAMALARSPGWAASSAGG